MKYYIDTEFLEGTQKEKFPISLFRKETPPTIDLISIGIVAEDGREYYAISKDFNLDEAWNRFQMKQVYGDARNRYPDGIKEYWLRENVLKPIWIDLFLNYEAEFAFLKEKAFDDFEQELKNGEHDKLFTFKSLKALINRYGKINKQIAEEIKQFVGFPDYMPTHLKYTDFNKHSRTPEFYAYYADYDWVAFCWLFGKMMDLPEGFPTYCKDLKQLFDQKEDWLRIPTKPEHINLKNHTHYPKQENAHNALDDARWNKKLHEFLNTL